jgi:hypothetical protein
VDEDGRDEDGEDEGEDRDRDDDDEGDDDEDEEFGAAAEVPEDWVRHDPDHAPWSIAHPPGWQIERRSETITDIRDPATGTYLRLDWTDTPAEDPLADWQAYEPQFAEGREGYERIRLESATFKSDPAALWEYRYRAGGRTLHAYNLNGTDGEYGYALNFQAAENRWAQDQPLFLSFAESYEIG